MVAAASAPGRDVASLLTTGVSMLFIFLTHWVSVAWVRQGWSLLRLSKALTDRRCAWQNCRSAIKSEEKVTLMRLRLTLLLASLIAALSIGSSPALATTYNTGHCGPAFLAGGHYRWYCTLWRDHVPVYTSPWNNTSGHGSKIGELVHGGRANWFEGQVYNQPFLLGSYRSHWWAYTEADNRRWGYVSLTYFKYGANDEPSSMACRWGDPHLWVVPACP